MKNILFILFSLFSSTVLLADNFLPPCNYPTLHSVSYITSSSAKISWTPSNVGSTSTVEYRKNGTMSWSSAMINSSIFTTTTTTISGLIPSTTYQVRIKTVCSGATLYSINKPYFTTLAFVCTNPIPTGLSPANGSPSPTTLSWGGAATDLKYSPDGGGTWVNVLVSGNSFTLPSTLLPGTYYWSVKNGCSNWATTNSFIIPAISLCAPISLAQATVVAPFTTFTYDLSWADCGNPSGTTYRVDCYDGQYGTWTTPTPLSSTPTSVRIKSKSICYWRVTAVNGGSYGLPAYSYDYGLPVLGSYMCPLLERLAATTQPTKTKEVPTSTLTLYPNPTAGSFTVEHPIEITQLEVVDMTGRRVWTGSTNGSNTTTLDISEYPTGVYIVKANNGMIQKVVKQ